MASIKFIIKSKKNPASLYLRFSYGPKKDLTCSTGISLNPIYWDHSSQKVKKYITIDYKLINQKLEEVKENVLNKYAIQYISGNTIDKKWLEEVVKKTFSRPMEEITDEEYKVFFSQFSDHWLKYYAAEYKSTSKKKMDEKRIGEYKNFVNIHKEYEEETKQKLTLQNTTNKYLDKFAAWMQEKKYYASSTTSRNIRRFQFFCQRAEDLNIPVNKEFNQTVLIKDDGSKEIKEPFLNLEEIDAINNLNLEENWQNDIKDNLIIACWTGLRISDFKRLKTDNIVGEFIEIKTKKTDTNITIPLHPMVKNILKKRNGNLPRLISEQHFNDEIKKIAKIAGLTNMMQGGKIETFEELNGKKITRKIFGRFPKNELITSHIGRRSFATNLFNKVPNSVIMAIGGWKSEKQMLDYIKMTNFESALQLKKFFDNL